MSRTVDEIGPWTPPSHNGNESPSRRGRAFAQTVSAVRGGLWAPIDALAAGTSMFLAHRLSPVFLRELFGPETVRATAVQAASFVLVAYVVGLYDWNVLSRRSALCLRAALASLLSPVLTLGFFYLVYYQPIGRWVIAWTIALSAPLILLPRFLLWRWLRRNRRRILFVGKSPLTEKLVAELGKNAEPVHEVVGYWHQGRFEKTSDPAASVPAEDLVELCASEGVDEVVLPTQAEGLRGVVVPALRCLPLGCRVRSEADFYEDVFRSVPVDDVTPEWMLRSGWDTSNHVREGLKRLWDAALALAILAATAPVALLAVLLIHRAGDGPVLYSQVRVGRYGRPFRIWKFRTMRVDAEETGAQWAREDDPRRTRLGRILRKTRIDELPQVVNILLGEMSFVGPRPERPEFVEGLEKSIPYYGWRHLVRPGLTGWAQIHCPYGSSVDDARRKLEYDLYYVRHASLATDLAIVLRTLGAGMAGGR